MPYKSELEHPENFRKFDTVHRAYCDIFLVSKEGQWGFVNEYGEEITPIIYQVAGISDIISEYNFPEFYGDDPRLEAKDFCCGLARVRLNGKWGFVNCEGEMVIPCVFDYADQFGFITGMATVQKGENLFMIDTKGKYVYQLVPLLKYNQL